MKNFINKEKMIPSREDVKKNSKSWDDSMDEWAKHRSIGFARWLSGEGYQQYDEADRWICPSNNNNVYTTEQLYNQYLQTLKP